MSLFHYVYIRELLRGSKKRSQRQEVALRSWGGDTAKRVGGTDFAMRTSDFKLGALDQGMAYISLGRVAQALETLRRYHPFFGVTYLSMKESGVSVGTPVQWGSTQEQDLLRRYYQPEGAPQGKEYYVPFLSPSQDHAYWKNPKYSGGSLQRARTTDKFKDALRRPTKEAWSFSADYLDQLVSLLPKGAAENRLPLNDLIAWLYRDLEVTPDLPSLQRRFVEQFKLSTEEIDRLFYVTEEDDEAFFFDSPIDPEEFSQLIGATPKGASFGQRTEDELIAHLISWLKEHALIVLPDGFVESVYFSLKTQPFLVLAGRPGTAKTTFAKAFAEALSNFFGGAVSEVTVSIGKEFTEADVVGYEKISGELASTDLTKRLFLSGRTRDIYVVVLDEMNLSEVDSYFARILPAIESGNPVALPGHAEPAIMPTDSFIIGTVNSYLEEPSRMPLSGPVKRRANIVEMPNHLTAMLANNDRDGFNEAIVSLITQSLKKIEARQASQASGVFDRSRVEAFKAALEEGGRARDPAVLSFLWDLCVATKGLLTLGVLQDIADYVVLSKEDVIVALDRQVARKVVPQLSGSSGAAHALSELISNHSSSELFLESLSSLTELLATGDAGGGSVIYKY